MTHHGGHYLSFLIFLTASIVLLITVRDIFVVKLLWLGMILGFSFLSYMITRRRHNQLILLSLGLLALGGYVALHSSGEPIYLKILDKLLWLAFTGYLAIIVFRQIFNSKTIGIQEIYGAISMYILVGLIFSQIFRIILIADPGALYFKPEIFPDGLTSGDVMYFSFVSLTTIGYGDITPASSFLRAVCVIESTIGIMYIATFIARFVSIHSSRTVK